MRWPGPALLGGLMLALSACAGAPGGPAPAPAPPRPVSTGDYLVGAYYFPGWPTHERWRVLDAFPERLPLLGYYREGDPAVMEWQIRWAVEHGIAFFAFDWYWDRGQRQLEHALRDGYLRAPSRSALRFCLLWANHNPPGSFSEADLVAVVDHWVDEYLRRPEYLTLDGRPVVIVFSPSRIAADLGEAGTAAAIARMRERARARGGRDLFLIGLVAPGPGLEGRLAQRRREGYDALSGYNYPSAGMAPGERQASYELAVEAYPAIWEALAAPGLLPYIPVVEPGWDSRPWEGARALVRTERTPAAFARMLRSARRFADRHPVAGHRVVLIEAWNEYGEGAAVEPHCAWGFAYLDAVREVFGVPGGAHRDVTPWQLGLAVPQVACPGGGCPDPRHCGAAASR